MSKAQENFEKFLDAQQKKEEARWFRDLPGILIELTETIKTLKTILSEKDSDLYEKFERNTLPKLRENYKIARDAKHDYDGCRASQEAIKEIMLKFNGWYRRSNICIGIKVFMGYRYTGKAMIVDHWSLIVSNDFNSSNWH
jgi:hypothetical protein